MYAAVGEWLGVAAALIDGKGGEGSGEDPTWEVKLPGWLVARESFLERLELDEGALAPSLPPSLPRSLIPSPLPPCVNLLVLTYFPP